MGQTQKLLDLVKTYQPAQSQGALIRAQAGKNVAFLAVCKMFAERERTAKVLTLQSLRQRMKLIQGETHARVEYANALMFLSQIGIGVLETSKRGKVVALKGITVPLQDIGLMALNKAADATVTVIDAIPVVRPIIERQYKVSLVINIDGEDIKFEMPNKMSMRSINLLASK